MTKADISENFAIKMLLTAATPTEEFPTICMLASGKMFINLNWFNSLTDDEKKSVAEHELHHIVNFIKTRGETNV